MCIIAVSPSGVRQPDEDTMRTMFQSNPDGAGYMVHRNGRVEISKGFMTWADFIHAVRYEHFTDADSVVYHFRISTQAGVNPQMTHPFPLSHRLTDMRRLDVGCRVGIAHNGIIRLTSDPNDHEYSDTAHYITEYLSDLEESDFRDDRVLAHIDRQTNSRWAIMLSDGSIHTVGHFIEDNGILYSNSTFMPYRPIYEENFYIPRCKSLTFAPGHGKFKFERTW